MVKRTPAVVKIPGPVRLIFIATALAPNRAHRSIVNSDAPRAARGLWPEVMSLYCQFPTDCLFFDT
ncbi:MAG: hypothetical protein WBB19_06980 [Desulforhopalus sp.]